VSDDLTLLSRPEQGPDDRRVETSENAAGNTGFDEVAVTLEKREIQRDQYAPSSWNSRGKVSERTSTKSARG